MFPLDENETDDPRAWTLSLGVAEALRAWRDTVPEAERDAEEHVFRDEYDRPMRRDRLAETLREHLSLAKVSRKQLFQSSPTPLLTCGASRR